MKHRAQAMAAQYQAGQTLQQIATTYGLTRQRVQQILVQHGVQRRPAGNQGPKRPTIALDDGLTYLLLLTQALGQTPVAADLRWGGGPSDAYYKHWFGSWRAALRAAGLTPRPLSHSRPGRLAEHDVATVVRTYQAGQSVRAIAATFHVTPSIVYHQLKKHGIPRTRTVGWETDHMEHS